MLLKFFGDLLFTQYAESLTHMWSDLQLEDLNFTYIVSDNSNPIYVITESNLIKVQLEAKGGLFWVSVNLGEPLLINRGISSQVSRGILQPITSTLGDTTYYIVVVPYWKLLTRGAWEKLFAGVRRELDTTISYQIEEALNNIDRQLSGKSQGDDLNQDRTDSD